MTLTKELATYESQKDSLLSKGEAKFVLIRDDEVGGLYDSETDAINEGYRRYGHVPFLVKKVERVEVPETFVSNLLAI